VKYRCAVIGKLDDGRTIQTFCPDLRSAQEWGKVAANTHKAPVRVWLQTEELIETIPSPVERTKPSEDARPGEAK